MTVDYPQEFTIFLVSTLTNDTQIPDRIYGKHGTLDLGGDVQMKANGEMFPEFMAKNDGKDQASIPTVPRRDLEGNFIDAIRGKDTVACNVDLGCSTMVAIKMAVESYRQSRTMLWDAKKERVVKG